MKKINLVITGCMGRMGQQFIRSAKSDKNFTLVALTENRVINKKINGIKPELNTKKAFKNADAAVVLTEWDEYSKINWEVASKKMRQPAWIFDARSIIDLDKLKTYNLKFWRIGDGSLVN